jgi:hypothetical protein
MRAILRNDDAEALLLDIRTGRHGGSQVIGQRSGAFLVFPTAVVVPGAASGHLVFPLDCDFEPGTLVTGDGAAVVSGTVAGVKVTGTFTWSVDGGPPAPAAYHFRRRGRELAAPPWAAQLPVSQQLFAKGPAALARQQARLRRRGHTAEHFLLSLSEQLVRQSCGRPIQRALRYRPPLDVDDLVQRSLQAAARLLPLYTSAGRPPCSWLGMLRLDGRRDLHRELIRLDWLPADAVAALALAEACGIDRNADPAAVWNAVVVASDRLGLPALRSGPAQLEAALRAPGEAARAAAAAATLAGPDVDGDEAGPVAASVARLVTSDTELITLAGEGDPRALKKVGDKVVRGLSAPRLSLRAARDGIWEEFLQTGQLFTTATGHERFGAVADAATLGAIDECLRRAARIRSVASTG